ncbi:hypothetical protein J2X69_000202 [Algoriphagus sp. 4150]|uniref:hypothetical protein n=1 Tax=Algoriphagus sp. 4150 TaxID=2817756 RepID=UPI0028653E65|nr:hypothetical protein [Algoriphagus sp. 4150]MDR7127874.1 hypothetical protein [Algoriphagus sp. 4150]
MTSLIPLKSDCSEALGQCIKECQYLIASIKDKEIAGLEKCEELAQLCIEACAECIDACESARLDRGKMMLACVEACKNCASECEKHDLVECDRCAGACNECLEELGHVLA